jgi:hypothetical protein
MSSAAGAPGSGGASFVLLLQAIARSSGSVENRAVMLVGSASAELWAKFVQRAFDTVRIVT